MRSCVLQTHSSENTDLFRLTLSNHTEYCERHGYDMVHLNRRYRDVLYDLDPMLKQLLRGGYDRVMTVGSDVIFTNAAIPLDFFDDGCGWAFIGEEGMGSAAVNFDMVLWTSRPEGWRVVERLAELRQAYANHPWGLQQGACIMATDPEMAKFLKVYPPRVMQSFPYPVPAAAWKPGDFSLHFVGMSNADKVAGCKMFLETGQVRWGQRVGSNDG